MNILDRIVDMLITVLNLANLVRLYGERQTRRFLKFELQLSIAMICLFIFGMVMGWEVFVVFSAFFASILGLVIWKQTEIVSNALSALSGIKLEIDNVVAKVIFAPVTETIKVGQKLANPVAEGMKKLLMPLVTVSLAVSFVASYIALKGLDYFNLKDLMIYSTIILFLAIFFWAYLETKKKWAGKAMFIWLLWLVASNYLWPIQCQELLESAENYTISWAVNSAKESRQGKIINIAANTPLYQYDHGNIRFLKTADKNMGGKMIGRKKSPNSDETLYRVILPIQEGNYIGGEEVYVPARLTNPAGKSADWAKKAVLAPPQSAFEIMPIGNHQFTVNKTMAGWMKIPGDASWDLAPVKNGNWKLITFEGEVVTYKAGGKKYANFPNQPMIFKVQTDEEMDFVLVVKPKV